MKKIFLFLAILITFAPKANASTLDRYIVVSTSDSTDFTTSVGKFWRWMETRVKIEGSNAVFTVFHSIVSGTNNNGDDSNRNIIISTATSDTATTDTVVYAGLYRNGAMVGQGDVFLRNTDELRVRVQSAGNPNIQGRTVHIQVIGEEI